MRGVGGLAVVLCCVLVAGCSTTTTDVGQPPTTRDLLLDKPPGGFTGNLDTALSIDQASAALSTDPAPTLAQLSALGYSEGAEKVWVRGTEYVIDLVFQFNSTVGPGSLVGFERSQLSWRAAVTLFDDGDVPGAQGIVISAVTRAGSRQVFCEGAIFALDRFVFEVEDCADGPRYSADPLGLTRAQYERAARLIGLPVLSPRPPTPSASPAPT